MQGNPSALPTLSDPGLELLQSQETDGVLPTNPGQIARLCQFFAIEAIDKRDETPLGNSSLPTEPCQHLKQSPPHRRPGILILERSEERFRITVIKAEQQARGSFCEGIAEELLQLPFGAAQELQEGLTSLGSPCRRQGMKAEEQQILLPG